MTFLHLGLFCQWVVIADENCLKFANLLSDRVHFFVPVSLTKKAVQKNESIKFNGLAESNSERNRDWSGDR